MKRARPRTFTPLRCCFWLSGVLLAGTGLIRAESLAPAAGKTGVILPIKGELTDLTTESLQRRVDTALGKGAEVIVLELDTPGGLVTSSIAIADLLRELAEVKTVAWVRPNAHSGGTIVAVAADEIVMSRSSRMGSAEVITATGAIPEELKAKAFSPVLADLRASCKRNGYSQVLCEAFVVPEREVWWIENVASGERRFVFREEKLRLVGETDHDLGPRRDPAAAEPDAPDEPTGASASTSFVLAKSSQGMEGAQGEEPDPASATPAKEPEPTDRSPWRLVEKYYDPVLDVEVDALQPIVRADQLLEVSAGEAYAYGFSKAVVSSEAELKERYGLALVETIATTWSEELAFFMTSIYVRGFLLLIMLLGAYVEFHTPGVGLPGLVALICLAIFVGAPYLSGLASVWEILLIGMGVALLLVELFLIPGFGVAGFSGIVLLLIGLVATFVPEEPGRFFPLFTPRLPQTVEALKLGIVTVVAAMTASLLGMVMLSKFLPKTPLFSRIVPDNPTPLQVVVEDPYRGAARVGDRGETVGPLRPGGKARFGVVLVDVVTRGEYLDPAQSVEVIERRGNHVVVRAVG